MCKKKVESRCLSECKSRPSQQSRFLLPPVKFIDMLGVANQLQKWMQDPVGMGFRGELMFCFKARKSNGAKRQSPPRGSLEAV